MKEKIKGNSPSLGCVLKIASAASCDITVKILVVVECVFCYCHGYVNVKRVSEVSVVYMQ